AGSAAPAAPGPAGRALRCSGRRRRCAPWRAALPHPPGWSPAPWGRPRCKLWPRRSRPPRHPPRSLAMGAKLRFRGTWGVSRAAYWPCYPSGRELCSCGRRPTGASDPATRNAPTCRALQSLQRSAHYWQLARSSTFGSVLLMKQYLAEFLGTFWLVFGGVGSALLAAGVPDVGIGYLGVALAFGLTVVTAAYAMAHISGAHFNPAVSVGVWMAGRLPTAQLLPYIVSQVLGGIAAAAVLFQIGRASWRERAYTALDPGSA